MVNNLTLVLVQSVYVELSKKAEHGIIIVRFWALGTKLLDDSCIYIYMCVATITTSSRYKCLL